MGGLLEDPGEAARLVVKVTTSTTGEKNISSQGFFFF